MKDRDRIAFFAGQALSGICNHATASSAPEGIAARALAVAEAMAAAIDAKFPVEEQAEPAPAVDDTKQTAKKARG